VLRPVEETPAKNELLSYGETTSYKAPPAEPHATDKDPARNESLEESGPEAALFAYMSGERDEHAEAAERPGSKRSKVLLVGAFAVACVVLAAVPRTRQTLLMYYRTAVRTGGNWLNPPPAPLPQAEAQHDSFGQSGDEYKLPATGNIPDATTDPSQIRVLPVIDPTAKTEKPPEATGGQAQGTTGDNNAAGPSQKDQGQTDQSQTDQNQTNQNHADQNQAGQNQAEQGPSGQTPVRNSTATNSGAVSGVALGASPATATAPVQPDAAAAQTAAPQPSQAAPIVRTAAPPHAVATASSTGIPSSLKSQMASSTPDASGNKPAEAAMSAIEPVNLPEPAARDLLIQPVDPEYPAAARASGQRGSVVLQVLIGRDGAVQDVKFLQGSLMFARAAIDAVRQWRFKPYLMNGRAVSVQSVITLNFKPPA
jgi:TonB family protein